MDWFQQSTEHFQFPPPSHTWTAFTDSMDLSKALGVLNTLLASQSFLNGFRVSSDDLYLANRLMESQQWSKIVSSKSSPEHVSRWFLHIYSLFPNPSFSVRKPVPKIDSRLTNALRSGDCCIFEYLIDKVDICAREPGLVGSRPIHLACKFNNLKALKQLLERGADIESQDEEGVTPIFYGAKKGHLSIVNFLVANGANIHHTEQQGRSLVYWACSAPVLEMIRHLISLGCDVNVPTVLGRTCLSKASWNGNEDLLRFLLGVPGINVNHTDKHGRTALHNAVWGPLGGRFRQKMGTNTKDSYECAKLLIQSGADTEIKDSKGNSAMNIACSTKAIDSLEVLIEYKADMLSENQYRAFPLFTALFFGFLDCAELLINNGFDLNTTNSTGQTVIEFAMYRENSVRYLVDKIEISEEDVIKSFKTGKIQIIELLYQRVGRVEGMLKYAIKQNNIELVRWVLEKDSTVSLDDIRNSLECDNEVVREVLEMCSEKLDPDILDQLIRNNCEISEYLHKFVLTQSSLMLSIEKRQERLSILMLKDCPHFAESVQDSGKTPLHLACLYNLTCLAKELLSVSKDPRLLIKKQDNHGMSSIDFANAGRNYHLAEILKEYLLNSDSISDIRSLSCTVIENSQTAHPMADLYIAYWRYPHTIYSIEESSCVWVDCSSALKKMVEDLKGFSVVGIDIEYHKIAKDLGFICLIQVSTSKTDYLIDCLQNRREIGAVMKDLMIDREVVKVMHGCDSDVQWLISNFDAFSVGVFDTGRAFKLVEGTSQIPSLATLIKQYLGKNIDKTFQVADWRVRPLPCAMKQYARADAHYLVELYHRQISQLSEEQINSLGQQCNNLCKKECKLKRVVIEESE